MNVETVKSKERAANILLVEDNDGDVMLAKKAFAEGSFAAQISVANDGIKALTMLRREPGYERYQKPDIILLDLNLPNKSGQEVLAEIKADEQLKHIPVVILTSSGATQDVETSYALHANGYIVKPLSLKQFFEVVKIIEQFWFNLVVLSDGSEVRQEMSRVAKPGGMLPRSNVTADKFEEFTRIIAHDLGAPLRGMVEFSRLLQDGQPDALNDDGKLYLSLIINNGEKLKKMLAALVDYSCVDMMEIMPSHTDLHVILQNCENTLKERIDKTKAQITIFPLPTVVTDAEQIQKIFHILLENALTFVEPEKTPDIQISARSISEGWVFQVKDNGIGFIEDFYDHIFKPFKRLHCDEEYPGIGMGLTLARKMLERQNGRIWVESIPRQGSTFFFLIPHPTG